MALSRDFVARMLFWSVIAVAVLMALGCFTPRENRIQKSASPEWSAVVGGTSRDKQATSPKKSQERPVASSRRPVGINRGIDWQVVGMIRSRFGYIIREASATYGIPATVIIAMIYEESKGDPYVISPKNCKGLMQICDRTAQHFNVGNVFNPRENVLGGTKILWDYLHKKDGDIDKAFYAFKEGPNDKAFKDPSFDPAQHPYVRKMKETIAYLSA